MTALHFASLRDSLSKQWFALQDQVVYYDLHLVNSNKSFNLRSFKPNTIFSIQGEKDTICVIVPELLGHSLFTRDSLNWMVFFYSLNLSKKQNAGHTLPASGQVATN